MSFILTYGKPGTSKTTLAATFTKLGHKVLFLDVDQKIKSMVNLQGLIESGDIKVIPIEAKLTESTLKQRILTPQLAIAKRPLGYLEFCDRISEIEASIKAGEPQEYQVLVVDSLTSLLEHLFRLIMSMSKKVKFEFDEWAIVLSNLEDFFYSMMALQPTFRHVNIIAHEQAIYDEDSGRLLDILPAIQGSMRNKVGKYFEEVYHTSVKTSGKGVEYIVTTKPVGKCIARTSRDLETTVPADFSLIFKEEMS